MHDANKSQDNRSPEWRGDAASNHNRFGDEEDRAKTRESHSVAGPGDPYVRESSYVPGGSGYGQATGYDNFPEGAPSRYEPVTNTSLH